MKRQWFAVAALAASWLLGGSLYGAPHWLAWSVSLALGVALLLDTAPARLCAWRGGAAVLLALPALLGRLPPPWTVVALLLAAGSLLRILPLPVRWPARLGRGAAEASVILAAQGLALQVYTGWTAWSHELPAPLAWLLQGLARLLHADAAYNGADVALFSMRKTHLLGATWEWLLDPVTLGFAAGGLALLALRGGARWRLAGRLLALTATWAVLRAGLCVALLLHRTLLTGYDDPLQLIDQFWSPWVLIPLLLPVVLAALRLLPLSPGVHEAEKSAPAPVDRREAVALLLACAAVAAVTAALCWNPSGPRKGGRVLVDEFHTTWEPTQKPFDTTWYGHDAGYNYACIYDYCSRFFAMQRLTNAITPATLAACDVLLLKVPTKPYADTEVDLLERYVEEGGSLLLVGEHTDVFLTSSHLNQVARSFGFEFRKDCVFSIDNTFEQFYGLPPVPHPVIQHLPHLDFAVSCSIAPRPFSGRAVIRGTGLWNLPADYHVSNFYPQIEDRAETRYGAFVQLWSTGRGKGRVLAFTDSTIFSNFSAFEPGKTELMLGMLEWLNHRAPALNPRPWLLGLGLLLGAGAAWQGRRRRVAPWLWLAVGLAAWCGTAGALRATHRQALPLPRALRPLTLAAIDRTVCDAPLSRSGFIKATPEGFGIFEQWLLRLGWFLSRREGSAVFDSQLIVFFHPHKPVSDAFRNRLERYVSGGGRVLVLDSALNRKSTANSLLHPFGLTFDTQSALSGPLTSAQGWPEVPATEARSVTGGEALARVQERAVISQVRHGRGLVFAVGCGARFNDDCMGISTDIEPTAETRKVFEFQFALLRALMKE